MTKKKHKAPAPNGHRAESFQDTPENLSWASVVLTFDQLRLVGPPGALWRGRKCHPVITEPGYGEKWECRVLTWWNAGVSIGRPFAPGALVWPVQRVA